MKKEYKIPELNTIQMKQIIKHLKENKEFNRKKDMDNLAQQFTEVLMLNGLDNAECSYVLLNTQRHLMSLEKNKEALQAINISQQTLEQDVQINGDVHLIAYLMDLQAKQYSSKVDKHGQPKYK